jgi:hypothetical protein
VDFPLLNVLNKSQTVPIMFTQIYQTPSSAQHVGQKEINQRQLTGIYCLNALRRFPIAISMQINGDTLFVLSVRRMDLVHSKSLDMIILNVFKQL